MHDHLLRAADTLDAQDRLLTDVLQADVARVTVRQSATAVRQNEDMRKISAWAAIALVPTAVAGVDGMNVEHMPELEWRYGYDLVLGVVLTVCTTLYALFERNGWLRPRHGRVRRARPGRGRGHPREQETPCPCPTRPCPATSTT